VVVLVLVALAVVSVPAQEPAKQMTFADKRDRDPMVSPDGKHLAFASNRAGNFDIYLLSFGEAGVRQLTQSEKDDRFPAWSRDGKNLLFTSKRTGKGDIYEMPVDGGSGYLQLTSHPGMDSHPSYTRSGNGLLFTTSPKRTLKIRTQSTVVIAEDKMRANNVRVLADGDDACFSPDGNSVVFVSNRTKNNDIWLMSADGGLQTQLTTDEKDDENPRFSPNGKRIVFASKRTGNFDIWVMNVDGSDKRQLTTSEADETQPCWSSGDYIYFTRDVGDFGSNIFRIPAP